MLGIAAANVCSVLDPSLVVLGGALAVQGAPLVERVRQIISKFIFAPPVVVSGLDKDAPLWEACSSQPAPPANGSANGFGNSSGRIETQRLPLLELDKLVRLHVLQR